jgi:hypothetical protein
MILLCGAAFTQQTAQDNISGGVQNRDISSDIERMHVLLSQMQKNAAFVSAGETPLKHEFELEIEMWQILLADMEKKANAAQPK